MSAFARLKKPAKNRLDDLAQQDRQQGPQATKYAQLDLHARRDQEQNQDPQRGLTVHRRKITDGFTDQSHRDCNGFFSPTETTVVVVAAVVTDLGWYRQFEGGNSGCMVWVWKNGGGNDSGVAETVVR